MLKVVWESWGAPSHLLPPFPYPLPQSTTQLFLSWGGGLAKSWGAELPEPPYFKPWAAVYCKHYMNVVPFLDILHYCKHLLLRASSLLTTFRCPCAPFTIYYLPKFKEVAWPWPRPFQVWFGIRGLKTGNQIGETVINERTEWNRIKRETKF